MEELRQRALKDWRTRTQEEIKEIEAKLEGVELGSDKDVILSTKLGKKRALIDGINEELDRSINRQMRKLSGEMP